MIYANYQISSFWDLDVILDDLGITRKQVLNWNIKWDYLELCYINSAGKEVYDEFTPNEFCASDVFDWKYPSSVGDDAVPASAEEEAVQ